MTKTSNIVSLIFGILTGNIGTVIQSAKKLAEYNVKEGKEKLLQDEFANEITQAFEMYVGKSLDGDVETEPGDEKYSPYDEKKYNENSTVKNLVAKGHLKKVNPKEQEQGAGGLNLKAIFKSDDKWEMHGIAQINRADVNAVSFGQWITFPVRSAMNLALRDVDFNQATEEASFNKKRAFYPWEPMDITNKLPESNVINGAAKKSIHKNTHPAYKTVPFIKQEYFNRIYWSKPNVSESFLNSFRMVYSDQYKEYNKEFGDITKILPIGNSLFVCFDHGMGVLPIDRTIKTESEASPYLASRNVLPPQVQTLSKDFGSMWKNSIIQTPRGLIYGVDTVAKKIWRTQGSEVEFISDHKVTKFLNEWIKLSEFDYKAYQGHIDVKTHYNNFKNDVMFTFVKDTPHFVWNEKTIDSIREYIRNIWGSGKQDWVVTGKFETLGADGSVQIAFGPIPEDAEKTSSFGVKTAYSRNPTSGQKKLTPSVFQNFKSVEIVGADTLFKFDNGDEIVIPGVIWTVDKIADIQQGKVYINDVFSGVWLDIESWSPGPVWSLCYNEVIGKFITFYDWYPVESCNVDNIYFSFDQEQIDKVYNNDQSQNKISYPQFSDSIKQSDYNKYFIDKTFVDKTILYRFEAGDSETIVNVIPRKSYLSLYYKPETTSTVFSVSGLATPIEESMLDGWVFKVWDVSALSTININALGGYVDVVDVKLFELPIDPETETHYTLSRYIEVHSRESDNLKYYDIRDYNPNRMYLWKHGYGGLYNNQGKIKPTNWYGKQHEFNFEFIAHNSTMAQKIFNNLKIISNKTQPKKFEYEIVGESYEWWPYKPVIQWANEKVEEGVFADLDAAYMEILTKDVDTLRSDPRYSDFPVTELEYRAATSPTPPPYRYIKLPYLKIELTDKINRQDKSYHPDSEDYWKLIRPRRNEKPRVYDYTFNTNETVIKYDEQLNEYKVHDEQLGNDMWKYGRVRGNMQYLEDYWNVEIRPINFEWCYLAKSNIQIDVDQNNKYVVEESNGKITKISNLKGVNTVIIIQNQNNASRLRFIVTGQPGQSTVVSTIPPAGIPVNTPQGLQYTIRMTNQKQCAISLSGVDSIEFIDIKEGLHIRPNHLIFKKSPEARHRDKYIKIKVRYSGEDLAVIQAITTLYNESYA